MITVVRYILYDPVSASRSHSGQGMCEHHQVGKRPARVVLASVRVHSIARKKSRIESEFSKGMNLKNKISEELEGIYRELDEELASVSGGSPGCDACGECCYFDKFDHVLYATMIEVDYIKRNVPVPQNHSNPSLRSRTGKNICPFLADNKCTIRDYRTLGCRVFYCNPDYQKNLSQEIYNKYYSKIKDVAHMYGLEWCYAPMLELIRNEEPAP